MHAIQSTAISSQNTTVIEMWWNVLFLVYWAIQPTCIANYKHNSPVTKSNWNNDVLKVKKVSYKEYLLCFMTLLRTAFTFLSYTQNSKTIYILYIAGYSYVAYIIMYIIILYACKICIDMYISDDQLEIGAFWHESIGWIVSRSAQIWSGMWQLTTKSD